MIKESLSQIVVLIMIGLAQLAIHFNMVAIHEDNHERIDNNFAYERKERINMHERLLERIDLLEQNIKDQEIAVFMLEDDDE
jgi:hypothetical protein